MSVEAMVWAWEQTGLSPADKLLLLALADGSGERGILFPGAIGRAAKRCGIDREDSISSAVRLSSMGLLLKDRLALPEPTVLPRTAYPPLTKKERRRREILSAWAGRCAYCGTEGDHDLDHVVPRARGGHDDVDNLVPACVPCNSRKGTRPVEAFVAHDPDRLHRIREYLAAWSEAL
jgi:5-methylcytosine-specific restriction endonuclease McrA